LTKMMYWPPGANNVSVAAFLLARMNDDVRNLRPAFFYLSWDGHATACSYEESAFYWFDPASGEFSIPAGNLSKWFNDGRVVGYINKLANGFPVDLIGFRKS
jgi:hypothetical protein